MDEAKNTLDRTGAEALARVVDLHRQVLPPTYKAPEPMILFRYTFSPEQVTIYVTGTSRTDALPRALKEVGRRSQFFSGGYGEVAHYYGSRCFDREVSPFVHQN